MREPVPADKKIIAKLINGRWEIKLSAKDPTNPITQFDINRFERALRVEFRNARRQMALAVKKETRQ